MFYKNVMNYPTSNTTYNTPNDLEKVTAEMSSGSMMTDNGNHCKLGHSTKDTMSHTNLKTVSGTFHS